MLSQINKSWIILSAPYYYTSYHHFLIFTQPNSTVTLATLQHVALLLGCLGDGHQHTCLLCPYHHGFLLLLIVTRPKDDKIPQEMIVMFIVVAHIIIFIVEMIVIVVTRIISTIIISIIFIVVIVTMD